MDLSDYHALTLTERVDFADDLAVFHLRADEPIDFTPGQYATLGLIDDSLERPLLRPYSVVSAPGRQELEFFIERVDDGDLTPRLWELEPGADVWMREKLVGRFVLDTAYCQHVMVATVTGIGPYISIARHQIQALKSGSLSSPHRMLILHGASRSWELGTYHDELRSLAQQHDWLTYIPVVSRPWEDPEWDGELGRVEDVLRKHLDASPFAPSETAAYTCGHPKMIDKAQGIFERSGFDSDAIHEEKYFVEQQSA